MKASLFQVDWISFYFFFTTGLVMKRVVVWHYFFNLSMGLE
jgi:hypothetical protein